MARASVSHALPAVPLDVAAFDAGTTRVIAPTMVTQVASKAAPSRLETHEWLRYYGIALAALTGSFLAAYFLLLPACARTDVGCSSSQTFRVSADFAAFAGLFVLALAVERLLEPLSRFIGPDTEEAKDERDEAQAAADEDPHADHGGTDALTALAQAQAAVDRSRQAGSILHWGIAAGVSFLLAAQLNVLLLAAITAEGAAQPAAWADLLVTGLVVGAGTKPLHDLVTRIEKSKEGAQDPVATGGRP